MSIARRILAVGAALAVAVTAAVTGPATSAQAITGADWNPGYIISDTQFYNGNAMTEAEIQAFLVQRINEQGGCLTSNCMALFRMDTYTRPADIRSGNQVICQSYPGAAQEPVSRIIFKVQQACGISARVLLVTMQKEQSILSARAPSSWQMSATLGYACPDSGVCDSKYYGVYNQLYMAAWQLKRYSTPTYDPFGNYQPGVRYIQYNPNPACGGTNVNILNNATAALYNYTPYQPNPESLANLYGSGGACGAHGNRNFWTYYHSWFGNPTGITPTGVTTARIEGPDRYATATKISQTLAPATANVVYVANGENYPDALGAAPAVTMQNGPLLLVAPTVIPPTVADELARLKPQLIVVVGSEEAVSAEVFAQLGTFAPQVRRDGGADRFETSRIIAENAFPAGTTRSAYLATGLGFADALTASAAAGSRDAPVILVDGTASALDDATRETLVRLGVTTIYIAGSNVAVSDGIAASAASIPGVTVTRLGGKDRFATASAINKNAFSSSATVYVSVANNFPDALAGAALAGATNSALLLSQTTCMYRQVVQDVIDFKANKMVMLGSSTVLSGGVSSFTNCD